MSKDNNKDENGTKEKENQSPNFNIFYIMDGIIDQLNKTKKLFLAMILTIMIIPPIVFVTSFILVGLPFHSDDGNMTHNKPWWGWWSNPDSHSGSNPFLYLKLLPLIPIIVVIVWLSIGIRQWFILSKWDKKYKKYKELQKKINERLEKDNEENNKD